MVVSVCLQGVGPRHRGGRGHHNLVHTASAVGGERAEADRRSVRREVLEGVRARVCDGTADGPLGATRSVVQNSDQRESGRVVHSEQLEGVAEGDAEAGSAGASQDSGGAISHGDRARVQRGLRARPDCDGD